MSIHLLLFATQADLSLFFSAADSRKQSQGYFSQETTKLPMMHDVPKNFQRTLWWETTDCIVNDHCCFFLISTLKWFQVMGFKSSGKPWWVLSWICSGLQDQDKKSEVLLAGKLDFQVVHDHSIYQKSTTTETQQESPFGLRSLEHGDKKKNDWRLPVFYHITLLPRSEWDPCMLPFILKTPKSPQIMKSRGCWTDPSTTFRMIYANTTFLLDVFRQLLT